MIRFFLFDEGKPMKRRKGRPSRTRAKREFKRREARRAALRKALSRRPPMRWLERLIGTTKGKEAAE